MKQLLLSPLLIVAVFVALLVPVILGSSTASAINAVPDCSKPGFQDTQVCGDVHTQQAHPESNPIVKIIRAAINVLSFIVGAAAVIGLIISSIRLIVSSGDSNAAATARNGIIYSLIGIAVVALAQAIVVFVLVKVK